jgi:hypothetical protein
LSSSAFAADAKLSLSGDIPEHWRSPELRRLAARALAHDGRERGSAARAAPVFFLDDETPSSVVARSKEGAIGVQRACRNASAQSRVCSRCQTFKSVITRTPV